MNAKALKVSIAIGSLGLFIIANNCQVLPIENIGEPKLLAHRGLAQTFDISQVQWDTNTAAAIFQPEHMYIENSIPSMEIAFRYGASIVEFDIRVTKDKELAVFHDYLVDYRTERKGKVSEFTLSELQEMDIGYGYTADHGATYPLRGLGRGLLPSFEEVLIKFKDKQFLVHIRDDGAEIGQILLSKLQRLNADQRENITVYGNDDSIELLRSEYPKIKALSAKMIKKSIIAYELIGWTGILPKSIRNMELHIPLEFARYLWGWPHIFVDRMEKANSRMVLTLKKGQWSGGFDTVEDIGLIPKNYDGFIWTERIDTIGPVFR